jgi:superfamily II DNA or RNA helicase
MLIPWPHQTQGVGDVLAAIAQGKRKICLTSPTGMGKTTIQLMLAREYLRQNRKVVIYTNRKMLLDQTSQVMSGLGMEHGVRAADHETDLGYYLQISSLQTEASRVLRKKQWELHDADLAIVDEAHCNAGPTAQHILNVHLEKGGSYVGFTATPLGIGHVYDTLVVAGTTSQGRACGALVPAYHYGPDEPDLGHIGKVQLGQDLTEKQAVKAIMVPGIFGRVLEWFDKLNPDRRPTILFAPGVKESIWFAEQFEAAGISAAHIDGQEVYVKGRVHATSRQAREDILGGSRDGDITVICNRFVLREGIDAPWLAHGIGATVFGSLQTYLQSFGRLLRGCPGINDVAIQDHGGNWHRHGSVNADRQWNLEYTESAVAGLRDKRLREKKEPEPARCPRCAAILFGRTCRCGYEIRASERSRPVVQKDGHLIEMQGEIYRPRKISKKANAASLWERMYYRARKAGMTFRQAEALFAVENNWGWPSHDLPLMPIQELDWFQKVEDVPMDRLKQKPVGASV